MSRSILNISAYKFVTITDGDELRERWRNACTRLELKGTILVAPEGLNLFLAGSEPAIRAFVSLLRADPRFADMEPKESWSDEVPFGRMLVKKKREIITMNRPLIRPEQGRARSVAPAELRRWLDQGHDDQGRHLVLLDTRNAFEVDQGAFDGCVDFRIDKFSEFPAAVAARAAELGDKRVVTFCTGGIRCEKAAILMKEAGVAHVVQLDGGILKYLEQVGSAHWHGTCFVFDERRAVDLASQPFAPAREVNSRVSADGLRPAALARGGSKRTL